VSVGGALAGFGFTMAAVFTAFRAASRASRLAASSFETSPEASSVPLPTRDVAYEGSEVYSAIIKLDPSAPYFVQSRTLAKLVNVSEVLET
jgi:hypothetical protein